MYHEDTPAEPPRSHVEAGATKGVRICPYGPRTRFDVGRCDTTAVLSVVEQDFKVPDVAGPRRRVGVLRRAVPVEDTLEVTLREDGARANAPPLEAGRGADTGTILRF